MIRDTPKIELLGGERRRGFVLADAGERPYLEVCPPMLKDAALRMLDTGRRSGEACALAWRDVSIKPSEGKKYGFIHVRRGKSAGSVRTVSLTERVSKLLATRKRAAETLYVFAGRPGGPVLGT